MRLAPLTLVAALAACDNAPPAEPEPPPPALTRAAAEQIARLSAYTPAEQCGRASAQSFHSGWKSAATDPKERGKSADYVNHYNRRLDKCFVLVTVQRAARGPGRAEPAPAPTVVRMLIDVGEGELLGEYLGPATEGSPPALPARCRVGDYYCGSGKEWLVLAAPYMER
ncbi:MAG TPA: hypothetical protein VMI15_06635 [Burkholderiales bacterium]|nr:hypothetical protein [Burkholderiales bacterium]